MQANIAKHIAAIAEKSDIEIKVHDGYSGRGMMGRATTAISAEHLTDLFAGIALAAADIKAGEIGMMDGGDPPPFTVRDLVHETKRLSKDSYGYGIIVY